MVLDFLHETTVCTYMAKLMDAFFKNFSLRTDQKKKKSPEMFWLHLVSAGRIAWLVAVVAN